MKEIKTIDQFMTQFLGIVIQFQTYGKVIEQKVVVQKILICLTKNFSMVVTPKEEAKDISNFTIE